MAPGGIPQGGIIPGGGIPIINGGGPWGQGMLGWEAGAAASFRLLTLLSSSPDLLEASREDDALLLLPRLRVLCCRLRFCACDPTVYRLQRELPPLLPLLLLSSRERLALLLCFRLFLPLDLVRFFAGLDSAFAPALSLPACGCAESVAGLPSSSSSSPSTRQRSTMRALPQGLVKFKALAALLASAKEARLTYANPWVVPVSPSRGMSTRCTLPCLLKSSRSSRSEVPLSKFFTNTLAPGVSAVPAAGVSSGVVLFGVSTATGASASAGADGSGIPGESLRLPDASSASSLSLGRSRIPSRLGNPSNFESSRLLPKTGEGLSSRPPVDFT
mmetsp:Transcript_33576/g.74813  ORF Transcript_33576/g.74813 Transcript_33576/m.74813 type:complete len:331 (-) Transcript_33576:374-1366(-)